MQPTPMPWRRSYSVLIGLAVGLAVASGTMLFAFFLAGDGNFLWAKVLYPYSTILFVLLRGGTHLAAYNLALGLAFVQYPVYGSLIGAFAGSGRSAARVAAIIGGVHVIAVAVCLSV